MLKQMNDDLIQEIVKRIRVLDDGETDVFEQIIKIDCVEYSFSAIEDTGWEEDDRGKYSFKTIISQLISYGADWKVADKFDVYFRQASSRTGSYYSDWYYSYEPIERIKRVEKIVPEVVIPEHTVIEWQKYV